MPNTSVATEVHQALDVHRRLTAQVTFDHEIRDDITNTGYFGFRQVLNRRFGCNAGGLTNLLRTGVADPIDRGQSNNDVLVNRNVYTCYTSHNIYPFNQP